jgi:hypothetical protein
VDEIRISPSGDPFHAAGSRIQHQDQHEERDCFACYEGVVYLGELVEDPETGEKVEVYTAMPCRRCSDKR